MSILTAGALAITIVGSTACSRAQDGFNVPAGTDVTLQKRDGVVVAGRLVEVEPEHVVLQMRDGKRTEVPRRDIASLNAASVTTTRPDETGGPAAAAAPDGTAARGNGNGSKPHDASPRPEAAAVAYRELTIPAGTLLPLELRSTVASDSSNVEDQVRATLRRSVRVNGVEALPAGTTVLGHVTAAKRSARVKGRARIAFRFTGLDLPGDGGRHAIRTRVEAREAVGTKKKDAAKIGAGAAGGAIIGGILGGGDGAAKGAAVGGAAGTGVVLSTRGTEVRLGPGATLSVPLAAPLTVRVRMR